MPVCDGPVLVKLFNQLPGLRHILVIIHPYFRPDLSGREFPQCAHRMGIENVCPDTPRGKQIDRNLGIGKIGGEIYALHLAAAFTTCQS